MNSLEIVWTCFAKSPLEGRPTTSNPPPPPLYPLPPREGRVVVGLALRRDLEKLLGQFRPLLFNGFAREAGFLPPAPSAVKNPGAFVPKRYEEYSQVHGRDFFPPLIIDNDHSVLR